MEKTTDYRYKEHLIERQARAEKEMLEEFHAGNYTLQKPLIKYNPYFLNALSAVILFKTEEETAVTVRVKGKTPQADFYQTFPKSQEHILPILGLYSNYDNQIEIYPWQRYKEKVTHIIQTPQTKGDQLIEKMETTPEYLQDQVIFLCPAISDLALAIDYAGDVRLEFTEPLVWDIKRLPNGNFLMGTERLVRMPYFVTGLYELSLVGKIYKEYRLPHGYHHDQITLPNGDIVALNSNFPEGTVEDTAVVLDQETGRVKKTFKFSDFIRPGAQKSGSWSGEDWFHCNGLWYDEYSNSLTLSSRHMNALFNIDFDTSALNWIISDPEGWPEEYQGYLFTPSGKGDFDWSYEPHSPLITPLGDVMCFDNHQYGSQNPEHYVEADDSFSRSVKYRIDTEQMEIEQVFQYGKERGKDFYSPYISNTIYYNEGHYLTHSGGIAYDSEGRASTELGPFAQLEDPDVILKSITVETVHDEVVLELEVNSNYYRANKITLYAKEKGMSDLEPGPGEILGSIGESRQMETRIPAEETGALLPAWHEARVTEEMDLVTFEAKFEAGTLAMLLLESEEDSRQYFISTSRGRRGAMCTGTFLPDDDRDTRTIISKEGLKGEYAVRVIVEDLLYETGITIQA